ncbi:molecular chaperone [Massilia sp. CFBP9026]|uniref:fimbrial biogenesis chaperone n=1 Tax=Massilia sp. CFBP9026 TaxID=3096536 RepID=UPI002A6A94A1|nr:molecular chaperone [Massilia sp. CFBP9026]MDY0962904.1 molecular chaperone [Massilia sp. CFBP9026]
MRGIRCAAFAAALLSCTVAQGANLQISPVSISFQPGQNSAGIQLQNNGDTPLYGQVRVYAWDQRDGVDALTPTTQLVASPPIIEIAANSTQTIRLVRRPGAAAGGAEQTYRILIDELPRGDSPQSNVAIRLQYSVPAFVLPADTQAAPALEWSTFQRAGAWHLRARNSGALHAQIGATSVRVGERTVELSKGLLGYALPGRAREWQLPPDVAGAMPAPLAIQATVNTRPQSASAAVARD